MEAVDILQEIEESVSTCTKCNLHYSRKFAVPGEGPANARVMFIGEGPGFHENQQGKPFVGAAGKFLDELLASAGLQRNEVFITNVVKCRPPGNRDPQPEELSACSVFLEKQISAINPAVIVTLGRFSMSRFFGSAKISQIHGQAKAMDGRLVVAMYHPAAALHQPSLKSTVIEDFLKLVDYMQKTSQIIEQAKEEVVEGDNEDSDTIEPTQLSLF